MFKDKLTAKNKQLSLALAMTLALFVGSVGSFEARAATAEEPKDISASTLQARLDEAENNYRSGKFDLAFTQLSSLVNYTDQNHLTFEEPSRAAKADLAFYQLKAGQPDQTAKLMCELLLNSQMELPMDPRFSTNPALVFGETPAKLKDYFKKMLKRLEEKGDFQPILDSIIDNTVPHNYSAQLNTYCKHLKDACDQLNDLHSIADSEELKYGDPLSSLDDKAVSQDKPDNLDKLDKLGSTLNDLATQAQYMPVADLRASLALYRLALVENSAGRYKQAETFAQQSINHIKPIADNLPAVAQIRVALAYALIKQGKTDEFKALRDDLLKSLSDPIPGNSTQERVAVSLARLTELAGDDQGAVSIYKRILDSHAKNGDKQKPEWLDAYNELLKKLSH
jgi:hypothetical protein